MMARFPRVLEPRNVTILKRMIIVAGLAVLVGCQSEASKLQQSVETRVRKSARDPSSIEFRNVRVSDKVVCGEVNGRSRGGGMTGFTPFAGDKDEVGIVPESATPGLLRGEGAVYRRLAPHCM